MSEPTSTVVFLSITKGWSVLASIAGSVVPILSLSEKRKTNFRNAMFMAISGSSFAIFIGPWIAQYFNITTVEALSAMSWVMGATGVYLVRAAISWIETRGPDAIDSVISRVFAAVLGPKYFESKPKGVEDDAKSPEDKS